MIALRIGRLDEETLDLGSSAANPHEAMAVSATAPALFFKNSRRCIVLVKLFTAFPFMQA
jgi:hypothetical protein